jgi:hypothetical protein
LSNGSNYKFGNGSTNSKIEEEQKKKKKHLEFETYNTNNKVIETYITQKPHYTKMHLNSF